MDFPHILKRYTSYLYTPSCILFVLCIITGFLFHFLLVKAAPQPFIWDQVEYESYAKRIMNSPFFLAAFGNRPYPYALFLALIYTFFGFGNHTAVYCVQIVVDILTAILIFIIVRVGLRRPRASWIAFFLYLFNPFTASYTGVILSETIATFFLVATFAAGMFYLKKSTFKRAILLGVAAGLTGETRTALLPWILVPLGFVWLTNKHTKVHIGLVGLGIGLLMTFIYPLYTNWQRYHEITISTVDNIFVMEFYNGAIIRQMPSNAALIPAPFWQMMREYYSEMYPARTASERHIIAKKYMDLSWEAIRNDPIGYVQNRFFKMWVVWQKQLIYPIRDPWGSGYTLYIFLGNAVFLIMALIGFTSLSRVSQGNIASWICGTIAMTIFYATVMFSLSQGDQRLTIPFYPLLAILASLTTMKVGDILGIVKKRS